MRVEYRYCPQCGKPIEYKEAFGRVRPVCDACGFIRFFEPKVAVCCLVEDGEQVLLVRRAVVPNIGQWALPAGYMDYDEGPIAAARREVAEETGLEVEITGLLNVFEMPQGGGIVIAYQGRPLAGKSCSVRPSDDVSEVAWFRAEEIPEELAFPSTRELLSAWITNTLDRATGSPGSSK